MRRWSAAFAMMAGLPAISAAQAGQAYHCEVTRGTPSGTLVLTSEVDLNGSDIGTAALWIGNPQPDRSSLQIRWQFANFEVVAIHLSISLALRKKVPDGSWLRLWHPKAGREGLTLSGPLSPPSGSRMVSASVDLTTLLAFARSSPKLSWQLVKPRGMPFNDRADTSGNLDIEPIGNVVADFPGAVAELKAKTKVPRSRCELGEVAEII